MDRLLQSDPPDDSALVDVHPPTSTAGGIPAIVSTTRHALREMGVVRGTKVLLRVNQMGGFDCPGCAWPEPDRHREIAEFCENGAKAVASEATTKRADAAFFARHSVADLAERSDEWLNAQGRLSEPMVLRPGATHYTPLAWEEAFALVGEELRAMASPDEAVFYTSGRTSNEAAFLYQLFVRMLGTNNLPDCSNMCHESSGTALSETIGVGKGTVTLGDFELADTIFVIGQNPGTNHPRMLTSLEAAARRGATIVSINPLPEAGNTRFIHPQAIEAFFTRGTELSSQFIQVRINGDVALLKGIMKEMLEEEVRRPGTVLDWRFIRGRTDGFEAFANALTATPWDLLVEQSGVSRAEMRRAAEIAMRSERMIVCWAMGLTQHKNAVANIQEIVNLCLLRGQIGRPGAGVCPVRGHSNVQGDRTMGIWEKMSDAFLDRLGAEFGFEPPRKHGYDTVASIEAMLEGKVRVFFAMGGNFLSAAPDTHATARALRRCKLTAHVSTKLHRGHLVAGEMAVILPCLGRTEIDRQAAGEQFVSVENSMGVVQSSEGRLAPISASLKSEPAIVAGLAAATFGTPGGPWAGDHGGRIRPDFGSLVDDYDRIRERIERVIPGFENYNVRVRRPGGFYLPNAARDGEFRTAVGKARFTVHAVPEHPLGPGQLFMMTIRSHDQYNTTVYGLDDRYRGIKGGRRVILMNEEDARERGLAAGDLVDLVSHFDDGERVARHFVVVPYSIPRRCTATYFPEANVLVPLGSFADKSRTPVSKSVVISVRRAEQ